MANVKWSAFPSGTTIGATDVTVGLQGGADVQWTMAQMKTWTSASPLLVTPALGTPSSGTLTSCTGLPISTGVSGLGTGVATALAVNVGSAGAFVAFNGALGTPSSGTATNLTGLPLTSGVTGVLPVANGGTNASSASITAFNNITGYTAAGATGTTSTNLVFSTSPMLVTPVLGAATGTSLSVTAALTAYSGTAIPAGGTAGSGIKFSSTANFGVFFGSGAPTLAAAQGAIYLRSDGTSSTGVYTNTDGSTTWAAIGGGGGGLTVGTTTIASGTTTRILYDNAGTLGEYTITGSGTVVAMQTSPSLVTPALGVATATSLAVNGATIGSNALAVTGSVLLGSAILTGPASATLQFGAADVAGSPVAQIISFQSASGVANTAGADATFNLSAGTGTGAGGKLAVYGAVTATSASTKNSLVRGMDFTPGVSSSAGGQQRIFNTYTDSSNGEWATFDWNKTSNVLTIGTDKNGTGSARNLQLVVGGTVKADYGVSSGSTWTFSAATIFTTNVTLSGAGSFSAASGGIILTATSPLYWNGRSVFRSPSDGVLTIANNAETDFSRLQFGGTTSSFPALKRSSTALQARLADDSAYAPFSAELVTVAAGTATPAAGSTAARLLFGTTSGFGIYYGSGAPTVSAAQGSIYLRSDGTGVADRMYVNSNGSTTWTNFVTAA